MSIYRRGNSPYWYCEFEDAGKPVRKSTGVLISEKTKRAEERSKAAARQAEALVRQGYFKEKQEAAIASTKKAEINVSDFSKKFLDDAAITYQEKPKTVSFFNERVRALLTYAPLKQALLSRLDEELLAEFIQWRSGTSKVIGIRKKNGRSVTADTLRTVSIATVNRDLAVLRIMLNKARAWKYDVAQLRIRLLKGEQHRQRIMTKAEEIAYLAAAPELLRDFATLALNTGMRPDSEICALRWEAVDFRQGCIYVVKGKTDNARRPIPMIGLVRGMLLRRHKAANEPKTGFVFTRDKGETALPYSVIDTQHDRVLVALDWSERIRIYDFRHTALTRLYQSGTRVIDLKMIAGHASVKTTERYINLPEGHQREAFAQLEQFNIEAEKQAKAEAEKQQSAPKSRKAAKCA
jgi:integrase